MRIAVIVDNNLYKQGMETAWGLSIYVEAMGKKILFDAGPDPDVLERNAKSMGIDLSHIDFAAISHSHGDHTGGLELLASLKPSLKVYIPPSISLKSYVSDVGLNPIALGETMEISEKVFYIKPLFGPPIEGSLALDLGNKIAILVGCSHPGVINIARQASDDLGKRPYLLIGGFHTAYSPIRNIEKIASDLIGMGIEKIYPIHCSGDTMREYMAERYGERYGGGGAGLEINLE